MTTEPPDLPPSGWYPDPADPTGRRYWDGHRWTEHTAASAWTRRDEPAAEPTPGSEPEPEPAPEPAAEPTPTAELEPEPAPEPAAEPAPAAEPEAASVPEEPVPAAATVPVAGWGAPDSYAAGSVGPAPPPFPEYQAYLPQTAPLAPSGMRRVAALFSDVGRILKRAWWQIILVSLVVWLAWGALAGAIGAALLDFGKLNDGINLALNAAEDYPNGRYPEAVADEIRDTFEAVPRTSSAATWIVAVGVLVLLFGLVACLQIVAVNRLGMDAAAGREVQLGPALRAGTVGGLRLFGYYLLLMLATVAVFLVFGLLLAAVSSVLPLLVLVLALGSVGAVVLWIFLLGRLVPIMAQVALGGGALRWTWSATRTKFWGVLGRYLLWGLVAGIIGQVVLSILTIPFFLVASASMATSPTAFTPATTIMYLATMLLSMVVGAITYVGIVPIWRDLTDDPTYRSIADGQPLPDPR